MDCHQWNTRHKWESTFIDERHKLQMDQSSFSSTNIGIMPHIEVVQIYHAIDVYR